MSLFLKVFLVVNSLIFNFSCTNIYPTEDKISIKQDKSNLLDDTSAVKIIFDTDMHTDCDDAGALAVLHALADNWECDILAVIVVPKIHMQHLLLQQLMLIMDVLKYQSASLKERGFFVPPGTLKELPPNSRTTLTLSLLLMPFNFIVKSWSFNLIVL